MIYLYNYWFRVYLRTRAKTYGPGILLSEGSKSLIFMFFLFTELNSIKKDITMLKKLPDHLNFLS